ncbi:hypothetical protein HXX02_00180 [Microbulbifer elongatus]|uniref:Lipoprotein n=1 Tax=Microbulbifer elongatus TaxID=86173 RepID=A0ABT1NX33_9GAMM|nr:hypothetical protein [Microbulbifer elongatus]MCQ3827852.1 hypothetical protein [Microbulbifer elongatus]
MKIIVIFLTLFISACVFEKETTSNHGFAIAYGNLQVELLHSVQDGELSVSFVDGNGNDLPAIAEVTKTDDSVVISFDPNWGREYGSTKECLVYRGEKYCRSYSTKIEFEEYLVVKAAHSPERKYLISDLKGCAIAGLVCENPIGGGRVVTLDSAVGQH